MPSLVEIGPAVLEKKVFIFPQCIFNFSWLFTFGNGRGSSFEHTWILITQKCFEFCLVEICQVVLHSVEVFSLFHNYLPLEKGRGFIFEKLESPSLTGALCQVWLKFAQWFSRRRFLKFPQCNLHYFVIISLRKRARPFIWTNLIPHDPRMLCAKLVETGPMELEKKMTIGKFTTTMTDKFWSETLTWAFGSGELIKKWTAIWENVLKSWKWIIIARE